MRLKDYSLGILLRSVVYKSRKTVLGKRSICFNYQHGLINLCSLFSHFIFKRITLQNLTPNIYNPVIKLIKGLNK